MNTPAVAVKAIIVKVRVSASRLAPPGIAHLHVLLELQMVGKTSFGAEESRATKAERSLGRPWQGQSTRGSSIVKAVRRNFRCCVAGLARKSKISNCHETWSAN